MKITTLLCAVLLCAISAWGQELQRRDQSSVGAKGQHETVSDRAVSQPQTTGTGPQTLPDKPEPQVGYLGQQFRYGEIMPEIPNTLVLAPSRIDGHPAWELKKVGSCFYCGEPTSFKRAMFDKPAVRLWALRTALAITDIEVTHRSPCFVAGTCREGNPLLGQTRAQAYGVSGSIIFGSWALTSYLRKGDTHTRMGGMKWWYAIPLAHSAVSVAGIVANLARN